MIAIKTRESAGDESKAGSTQAKATMKAAVIRGFGNFDVLRYEEIETPKFAALQKGLTVRGYTLFEITGDPIRLDHGKQFVYDGLASGALKPVIDSTFPLDSIADAHRYMESNRQTGKIVVTVGAKG